jgi:hypothetical protein
MTTEVYINGQLIDLDEDTNVAATYGNITFGELNKRKGIKSPTWTAPFTNRNKLILESCELSSSDSAIPYRNNLVRIDIEGITVFEGFCIVSESDSGYEIESYAGASGFYSYISKTKLSEVDLSQYDHVWGESSIRNSWNRVDGYIYAFAEYGKGSLPTDGYYPFVKKIQPDYLLPQIFFHTLIRSIAETAGYTVSGNVFNDDRFLKHLVLVNKFPLPISYGGTFNLSALLPDLMQSTVWLDFANIYGQQFDIDDVTKEIRCSYIDDLLFNETEEWTERVDQSEKQKTKYRIDNYGQTSYLRFKSDATTEENGCQVDYAKGVAVDDQTMDPESDIYKSGFYLIQNDRYPDAGVPSTKTYIIKKESAFAGVWDAASVYVVDPGKKLYVWRNGTYYLSILNPSIAGHDPIIYGSEWTATKEKDIWDIKSRPMYGLLSIDASSPMIVSFSTPQAVTRVIIANGMDWPTSYQRHYGVFSRVLKRTKLVEKLIKLNYADINQIDFTKLKVIDGELYVLEEITQFKLNKPDSTICKLIRL